MPFVSEKYSHNEMVSVSVGADGVYVVDEYCDLIGYIREGQMVADFLREQNAFQDDERVVYDKSCNDLWGGKCMSGCLTESDP